MGTARKTTQQLGNRQAVGMRLLGRYTAKRPCTWQLVRRDGKREPAKIFFFTGRCKHFFFQLAAGKLFVCRNQVGPSCAMSTRWKIFPFAQQPAKPPFFSTFSAINVVETLTQQPANFFFFFLRSRCKHFFFQPATGTVCLQKSSRTFLPL